VDGPTDAEQQFQQVDRETSSWRQGDIISIVGIGTSDADLVPPPDDEFPHWVLLTQTCDVVRAVADKPRIQISPLVTDDPRHVKRSQHGHRPNLVHIPGGGENAFAAMDRMQSVPKAFLLGRRRTPGVATPDESRRLARSLGRYFSRFPFPDHVSASLRALESVFRDKYDHPHSPQGELLEHLQQVRAQPLDGEWSDQTSQVSLAFIFAPGVVPDLAEPPDAQEDIARVVAKAKPSEIAEILVGERDPGRQMLLWYGLVDAWVAICVKQPPLAELVGYVSSSDVITAQDLWLTDVLDLEHLSWSGQRGESNDRG
jgi:hypothetical protein